MLAGPDNEAIRETRNILIELTKEIKKQIQASNKLNKTMLQLTAVMAFIAIIQFLTEIAPWLYNFFTN